MARLPRYFAEGQPQHLIQRGNNREPIFAADVDRRFYLDCLQDAADRLGCAIHAYVLMTNHVHLLVTAETPESLPKTLQSIGRRYVQYFNYTYGMVAHPGDYPWSSYRANAMGNDDLILTPHSLYRRLGRSAEVRQSTYRQLFRAHIAKADLEAIREATNKAWVLGNDRFREKVEALAGRRSAPQPRGRPRKDRD